MSPDQKSTSNSKSKKQKTYQNSPSKSGLEFLEQKNTSTSLCLTNSEIQQPLAISKNSKIENKEFQATTTTTTTSSTIGADLMTFFEKNERLKANLKYMDLNNPSLLEPVEQEDEKVTIYGISDKHDSAGRVYMKEYIRKAGSLKPDEIPNSFRWTRLFLDLEKCVVPACLGSWAIGKVKKGKNAGDYWKAIKQLSGDLVKGTFQWIKKDHYKQLKKNIVEGSKQQAVRHDLSDEQYDDDQEESTDIIEEKEEGDSQ